MKIETMMDVSSRATLAAYRQKIAHDLAKIAAQAQRETLLMAKTGAMVGIYLTPSGAYQRTGHYLNTIYAVAKVQAGIITIEVGDKAAYASYLEYGAMGQLTPAVAEQLAEALGAKNQPLYLGRSGLNWVTPNPAITRAAVFGGLRMKNLLATAL